MANLHFNISATVPWVGSPLKFRTATVTLSLRVPVRPGVDQASEVIKVQPPDLKGVIIIRQKLTGLHKKTSNGMSISPIRDFLGSGVNAGFGSFIDDARIDVFQELLGELGFFVIFSYAKKKS